MQKQKAERIKRQKEEERRQKQAMVVKQQQLKDLESRQKQSAVQSKKVIKVPRKKTSLDETFTRPMTYNQLPHHHPFHEEHQHGMATSDSEAEPHGAIHRDEEMEMSDDSLDLDRGVCGGHVNRGHSHTTVSRSPNHLFPQGR